MESKVCYISNFWLGERRRLFLDHDVDRFFYLKKQIEYLQIKKHNLTKIIFNFNIIPEHYQYISKIFAITPKQIQGAEVEINLRENYGISYGAWSDLFSKYRSEYDYYIFNEDDYFYIQDNWDTYLVNKYNSYDDCGYLCMFMREPAQWNNFKKYMGSSGGISSTENLMKVYNKYGKLPSLDKPTKNQSLESHYSEGDTQHEFSFSFLEVGLNVYDIRDDYCMYFAKGSPPGFPECDVWKIFGWNPEVLFVPAHLITERGYKFFICHDDEFREGYIPTTFEEALYCYNNKVSYMDMKKEKNE